MKKVPGTFFKNGKIKLKKFDFEKSPGDFFHSGTFYRQGLLQSPWTWISSFRKCVKKQKKVLTSTPNTPSNWPSMGVLQIFVHVNWCLSVSTIVYYVSWRIELWCVPKGRRSPHSSVIVARVYKMRWFEMIIGLQLLNCFICDCVSCVQLPT